MYISFSNLILFNDNNSLTNIIDVFFGAVLVSECLIFSSASRYIVNVSYHLARGSVGELYFSWAACNGETVLTNMQKNIIYLPHQFFWLHSVGFHDALSFLASINLQNLANESVSFLTRQRNI